MGKLGVLFILLLGVALGLVAVEMGVLDSSAPGDRACNGALGGQDWAADLNASSDVGNGTRLVCVHDNGTRSNVTVNVSIETG